MRRLAALLLLTVVAACSDDPSFFPSGELPDTTLDGSTSDTGLSDAGLDDTVPSDTDPSDTDPPDGSDDVDPDAPADVDPDAELDVDADPDAPADVDPDAPADVDPDVPEECVDVSTCTTEGLSCDGADLVTCAADANGCLIAFRTACDDVEFGYCEDGGAVPQCAVGDACTSLPDACDAAGRSCDGNTLIVCAENTDGCLTERRTSCDDVENGFCDGAATPVACGILGDACLDLPNACEVPGTSCDGDSLVTCASDAFGCLVETRTDCTERDGECVEAGGAASCRVTVDPCEGVEQCAEEGALCDGETLVVCEADDFGCLVEERTVCDDVDRGFCDDDALQCAVTPDPCAGIEQCATPGRRCVGEALVECTANAFGCLIETVTSCPATGRTCDMGACVDPCSLVDECDVSARCDGDVAVTCAEDADGCLVEVDRNTCGGDTFCEVSGGVASCVDPCAGVAQCDPAEYPSCAGAVAQTCVENADGCFVLRSNNCGAIGQLCSDGFCEPPCGNGRLDGAETCDDGDTSSGDGCSSSCREESGWTCVGEPSVCTRDARCGDGVIDAGETCDDGDAVGGDGCSSACRVESGWSCVGAPSICTFEGGGDECGNGAVDSDLFEGCDDANTVSGDGCSATCALELPEERGVDVVVRGEIDTSAPLYDRLGGGCSGTGRTGVRYLAYRLVNPSAGAIVVDVQAFFEADGFLHVYEAGFDPEAPTTGCIDGDDDFIFGGETGTRGSLIQDLTVGAGDEVVLVVSGYNAGSAIGAFTVEIRQPGCGDGILAEDEVCDDDNLTSGDGCSSACNLEAGFECSTFGSPTTCREIVCGDGIIDDDEECDDGDLVSGDGCSSTCELEERWVCLGEPSSCRRVICGDGIIDTAFGEACDDDNGTSGDGCSSSCQLEDGFYCESGQPTVCEPDVCGDGYISVGGGERCDDDNAVSGDGCSSSCQVESAFRCEGAPSDCRTAVCGDDFVALGEGCDGETPPGSFTCSGSCRIEMPGPGGSFYLDGAIRETDSLYRGLGSSCFSLEGSADAHYYDAYTFTNPNAVPVEFDVITEFSAGGDVQATWYTRTFNPLSATSNCVETDEYFGFSGASVPALRDLSLAPGETGVLVLSGESPEDAVGPYRAFFYLSECGDGEVDDGAGEECDDDNLIDGDGCSSTCEVEPEFVCTGEPSICDGPICGDGFPDGDEVCDDGNFDDGDGCSSTCEVEDGFLCTDGFPSVCEPGVCGDGIISELGGEACDDDNADDGDGCSSSCVVEEGAYCNAEEPSLCVVPVCGDGELQFDETCDGEPECVDCALPLPSVPGETLVYSGTLSSIEDPVAARTSETCSASLSSAELPWEAFRFTNTTDEVLDVDIRVAWGADGYLLIYDAPFNPSDAVANCRGGDDDFNGTSASRVEDEPVLPGETIVIVLTDYSSSGLDPFSYELTIGTGLP